MDRETKHGPRLDEQMKKEAGSIPAEGAAEKREEYRRTEGLTDEDRTPTTDTPGSPSNLSPAEVELRSDIARYLVPSAFPADKAELLETARESQAPDLVLGTLERLPEGQFENVQAVWEALGGSAEERT
jgi:hypothetical protein